MRNRSFVANFLIGFVVALTLFVSSESADTCTVNHFAGAYVVGGGYSGDGGPATSAKMKSPEGTLLVDSKSSLLIADQYNCLLRKVDISSRVLTTYGGRSAQCSSFAGNGGLVNSGTVTIQPTQLAADSVGTIYVTERGNHVVRRIGTDNIISVFAFDGTSGDSGAGGKATSAKMSSVNGVAVDSNGDVYLSSADLDKVNKVTVSSGMLQLFMGNGNDPVLSGGRTSSFIAEPADLFIDSVGNLYVSERISGRIYKAPVGGNTMSLYSGFIGIGSGYLTYSGDGGPATSASFAGEQKTIAGDTAGGMYVSGVSQYRVRYINPSGIVNTIAGSSTSAVYTGEDGQSATSATFKNPAQLTVEGNQIYVSDSGSHAILVLTCGGSVAPSVTPTTLPSALPTVAPSVEPSAVPSLSFSPSQSPSVEPSVSPSATPSVVPSALPSVTPSVSPSQVPSMEPSATPSVTPTIAPSAVPSVQPSVEPTMEPSVEPSQKPSRSPSQMPTVRPSRSPSAKPSLKPTPEPTVVFSGVQIGANVTIDNVYIEENRGGERRRLARAGSRLLMEVSDNAIITAVAEALGLSENAVTIESEHIVSNVTNVATVLVAMRILAPAQGFASYEACYTNYTDKLSIAVTNNQVQDRLVAVAEDIGAYELYQITAVNIDALANEGAEDTSEPAYKDGDDLSTGYFAGVVIGVIVAFLVLFALVYFCIVAGTGGVGNQQANGSKASAVPADGTSGALTTEDTKV